MLKDGWEFHRGECPGGESPDLDTSAWESVRVPHDWAIAGPFDEENDAQFTSIEADGETRKRSHTGRTGGLPHVGSAWYRRSFELSEEEASGAVRVEFDGVMSNGRVFCNGVFVGEWPYGYASFAFDLTGNAGVGKNLLAVSVENRPSASRWYPGAGIYRNVRIVTLDPVHVAHWGARVTSPEITGDSATVRVVTKVSGADGAGITLETVILDPAGNPVAETRSSGRPGETPDFDQTVAVPNPSLWSPHTPALYTAVSTLFAGGRETDRYETRFGLRSPVFDPWKGFSLNGETVKLNGVCMHHDLGPIGTAVNTDALRRQLVNLREMGCNAIRTSHNPPAPELLDLCDEMGFLVIDEAFDEWRIAKVDNGYHRLFDVWAERDLRAMIRRDANHPCVIMWSIGNEIQEQGRSDGHETARFLAGICRDEDPTRPTTAGFNNSEGAIVNGLAAEVDVPGWNYKPHRYLCYKQEHPEWPMYGSETESCVSSRDEYYFPPEEERDVTRDTLQVSSYDLSAPSWGYSPDVEFRAQDEYPFIMGEFVWTGWDYLGEPTPYKVEWPSRSSYFGIVDLAGIPKDRYFLYRSKWTESPVLHLLPHWTWPGMEGEQIPVHCYTNFERVELFLNGVSLGTRRKEVNSLTERYRLIWNDVRYEPGELKAVAFGPDGHAALETTVWTAGLPARIELIADRTKLAADGDSMAFVELRIVDSLGTVCPNAGEKIDFRISGPLEIAGVCSGDPTSLDPFGVSWCRAFHGKCVVYLRSIAGTPGGVVLLEAASPSVGGASCMFEVGDQG